MVLVALPMATRAPVLLLAVRNGDGVEALLITARQVVNQALAAVMEEEVAPQPNLQRKAQPLPRLHLPAAVAV